MPASLSSFLLSGSYWNGIEVTNKPVVVTYSFPLVAPAYDTIATDPNLTQTAINSFAGFNAAQQQLAVNAMNQWGTVLGTSDPAAEHASGIVFVQVAPGLGDVNFQTMNLTGTGYAGAGGVGFFPFGNWTFASSPYFFDDLDYSGDVVMNQAAAFDYATLIHEVGHAIGLKHPTETDTGASGVVHPGWDPATDPNLSIMSATGGTAQLPTALDRQAVQTIYGTLAQGQALVAASNWNAATSTLTQHGTNGLANAIRGVSTGDIVFGGDSGDKIFTLAGNDTVHGGIGNDYIDGGSGNDDLSGGAGNDTLIGTLGSDTLRGGAGNDYYIVNPASFIYENAGEGIDTVEAGFSYVLGDNLEVLFMTGSGNITEQGNGLANTIYGNSGTSTIYGWGGDDYLVGSAGGGAVYGGDGNDTLYGGSGGAMEYLIGGAGNDYIVAGGAADERMIGGTGDDTYVVNSVNDIISENAGEGTDTVYASVNYTTPANIEILIMTGSANLTGAVTSGNDSLYGNSGTDTLYGGAGNDYIVGSANGGSFYGGAGNDTIYGGSGGALEYLIGGAGDDYIVAGGAAEEHLFGGDGNDTLLGGNGNDSLYGGNGNDRLEGKSGSNVLYGGAGADTFVFDTAGKTSAQRDWIVDFEHGIDKIETNLFAGLGTVIFATGTTPNTPTDANVPTIFYRSDYGGILFDAGAGQNGFIEIARVVNHATTTVTASDFVLTGATF